MHRRQREDRLAKLQNTDAIHKRDNDNGIQSILTTPKTLSVDVINKYLELKTRQLLS